MSRIGPDLLHEKGGVFVKEPRQRELRVGESGVSKPPIFFYSSTTALRKKELVDQRLEMTERR